MREISWRKVLRIVSIAFAVLVWVFSVKFSMDGFDFNVSVTQETSMVRLFSLTMALLVTFLELMFDEDGTRNSYTLVGFGILAYGYGILTNFMGIFVLQGRPDYFLNPEKLLFNVIVSLMMEIIPEQLLLWGFNLTGRNVRDLVTHILGDNQGKGQRDFRPQPPPRENRPPQPQQQEQRKRGRPPKNNGVNVAIEHPEMEEMLSRMGSDWSPNV